MGAWLLLLLTILCAWLTYDAWRWRSTLEKAPFSVIANLWRSRLEHLSLAEQNKVRDGFASFQGNSAGGFVKLFLVVTIILAALTVRAFLAP